MDSQDVAGEDDQESKEDHSRENTENKLKGNEQNDQDNYDEQNSNNTDVESKSVLEESNAKPELADELGTKRETGENSNVDENNVIETSATEQSTEAMNEESETSDTNENDRNEVLESEERIEKSRSEVGISEKRDVSNTEQFKADENSKGINNGKSSAQEINTITEDTTDAKSKDVDGDDVPSTDEGGKEDLSLPTKQTVEESKMDPNFYYENEDLFSKPCMSDGMMEKLLQLHHSFGFDCKKRSNLLVVSSEIIVFTSGNFLQVLNIKTKEQINIHTTRGGGMGAIAAHPNLQYIAVSEKGTRPDILIYEYPSLRIYRVLRNGTEKAYSNLDFSQDGAKLASVGSFPDYMLTIWNWGEEQIILRSKAFSQDIYKIAFSPDIEGHLCSSGAGHIKFWSMASTFTGLKLQGELGRFGTTELSDITGFVELPDGKVLSGSEWGNMLLWDGGLIKAELCRKGKKSCHNGSIEQFCLDEGELITIGLDGFVKVWDFETIDAADSSDENKLFELEPMSELKIGADVKLVSMIKSVDEEETSIWYAQDACGAIWKLDLSFSHTSQAPEMLFSHHAGAILGVAVSPIAHLAVTAGEDGTVRLVDYVTKTSLSQKRFNKPGCSVLWVPKVVDEKCSSVLVGFDDGVVRHISICKYEQRAGRQKANQSDVGFHLTQVFKPHLKAVNCLKIDGEGKVLATGGDDCTIFFFTVGKKYEAIGFVELETEIVDMQWSTIAMGVQKEIIDMEWVNKHPSIGLLGNRLLVAGKDGSIFEFSRPTKDKVNTSKTFKLPRETFLLNSYKFQSVKDTILKIEADKEKEKLRKEKEALKAKRRDKGEGNEETEENEEEEEEEETYVEHDQGDVLNCFYSGKKGRFFINLDDWDAGYIYECSFTEPCSFENVKAIPLPAISDVPVTTTYLSKNGKYLIMGLKNGMIRVQDIVSSYLQDFNAYWCIDAHDNDYGAVTDITLSHDGKYLLSVGEDGSFFVYLFAVERSSTTQPVNKIAVLEGDKRPADDIDDPNYYSIELEKQKAEHDLKMKLASQKKQNVRQTIDKLRRDFRKLRSRNNELPSYIQLPYSDFIIDPKMATELLNETEREVELLKKELAWNSEKQRLALEKLQNRFEGCIEADRFVVYPFLSDWRVPSYRLTALTKDFYKLVDDNKRKMTLKMNDGLGIGGVRKTSMNSKLGNAENQSNDENKKVELSQTGTKTPKDKLQGEIAKVIQKAEERKQKRLNRQKEWDVLRENKPDINAEDPEDVLLIKHAEATIGDYKLKTSKNFSVSEEKRENTEKKRAQMLNLKIWIHDKKSDFNDELIHLRDTKAKIIEEVQHLISQLVNIQSKLGTYDFKIPEAPSFKPVEFPERYFSYTLDDLISFCKNVLKIDTSQLEVANGMKSQNENKEKSSGNRSSDPRQHSSSLPRSASSVLQTLSMAQSETPTMLQEEITEETNEFWTKIQKEEQIRLLYEKDQLLQEIHGTLFMFDTELKALYDKKVQLDVDLKNADLRLITLFEELLLLKDFEKRENELALKVMVKMQEKEDMVEKVEECKKTLNAKKEEVKRLMENEKTLLVMFSNAIGDNNKLETFLVKVFRKKVKRPKKKTFEKEDEASEQNSDEDDESSEEFDSEDESDSDNEFDDSICPPGCDQVVFDQVCQLREKRLDLEEVLADAKKACDTYKKELDTLTKKVKIIENNLANAASDLEAFQREKQEKLNELEVVVTINLEQVQYVNNNTIPQDLSPCLIFDRTFLDQLQQRIKELEREKSKQKHLYRERRQQHVQMIRDKKTMENKIKELEKKVEQIQMLKFGRLVDLEKLETISVNRVAEELKVKLKDENTKNSKEIREWDKSIDAYQSELTKIIRENTKRLDTYTVLLQQNEMLENHLNGKQRTLGSNFQGYRKSDLMEHQRLVQLVQLQSQEIDSLKDEISSLSRKGGHMLPPSRPKENGSHNMMSLR